MALIFSKPWQRLHPLAIYAPLLPRLLWLSLRHQVGARGLFRVNPALKYGGATIDSKFERYRLFQQCEYAIPTVLVEAGGQLQESMLSKLLAEHQIDMPVIVKPDLGFLSQGVFKHHTLSELTGFLKNRQDNYLIQPYLSEPLEYAVYYYRLPGEPCGVILDITERVLPYVMGDGRLSIAELIDCRSEWVHAARAIRRRYRGDTKRVPRSGEKILLAEAARGAQGAFFVDSRHLKTLAIEKRINAMVSVPGFFLGKFDFKVASEENLAEGEGLKLLEVNGVTSELNHIYDLRTTYREAHKAIAFQFTIMFEIAKRNKGQSAPPLLDVISRFRHVLSAKYV